MSDTLIFKSKFKTKSKKTETNPLIKPISNEEAIQTLIHIDMVGCDRKEVKKICGNFYRVNFYCEYSDETLNMSHYAFLKGDQGSRMYELIRGATGEIEAIWISDSEAINRWKK